MTDNPAMKKALIMQSFAPLFLILLIKYFDLKLFHLCKKFSDIILNNPIYALTKAVNHSAFVTLILRSSLRSSRGLTPWTQYEQNLMNYQIRFGCY